MRHTFFRAAALAGLALLPLPAAATTADDVATLLFGRNYHDNVTVINIADHKRPANNDLPPTVSYATPRSIAQAQQQADSDPMVQEALARRGIKLHNVVLVQTAMNGGKIVYVKCRRVEAGSALPCPERENRPGWRPGDFPIRKSADLAGSAPERSGSSTPFWCIGTLPQLKFLKKGAEALKAASPSSGCDLFWLRA